jgi:sugar/nucleoside kinase (ribokinase family)
LTTFSNLDWKRVKELIDLESVRKKVADASLVALVDWCNLPHATSIWKGILGDLITACPQKEWTFFFDLADPSKKGKKEIEQVLSLLREFMPYGEVILGLNENETQVLARLLGHSKRDDTLERLGKCLFEHLKIDRLVVHPVERALVFEEKGIYSVVGRLVEKPLVTTGAGDNFNAGFVLGLLHRFPIEECLVLATAASGFYVEHGRSASQQDLCGYLAKWQKELNEVNP